MKITYENIEKYYGNNVSLLAKDLNITREYWYLIRKRKRKPSAKIIYNLSKKMNIEFKKLFIFFEKQTNIML